MDDAVKALSADGICAGLRIPDAQCRAIRRFADETPCFGDFDRHLEFPARHYVAARAQFRRPLMSGHYFDKVEECEEIAALRHDPFLLSVAERYLEREPRLISTRLWWEFPLDTSARKSFTIEDSQERYHFDLDDWKVLKFFFYLTDVDLGAGPHVYVRGTHARRLPQHQFVLFIGRPVAEIEEAYGAENALTLLGPSGYGFVEDAFGFHRGTRAQRTPRLALEIGFGVSGAARPQFYGEPYVDPRAKLPPLVHDAAPAGSPEPLAARSAPPCSPSPMARS